MLAPRYAQPALTPFLQGPPDRLPARRQVQSAPSLFGFLLILRLIPFLISRLLAGHIAPPATRCLPAKNLLLFPGNLSRGSPPDLETPSSPPLSELERGAYQPSSYPVCCRAPSAPNSLSPGARKHSPLSRLVSSFSELPSVASVELS